MTVLFEGSLQVAYGQAYVEGDVPIGEQSACFAGQKNGIFGAAVENTLFLRTGLHTGHVGFRVELSEREPPLDSAWEEVVEASFCCVSEGTNLVEWGGEATYLLDLPEGAQLPAVPVIGQPGRAARVFLRLERTCVAAFS